MQTRLCYLGIGNGGDSLSVVNPVRESWFLLDRKIKSSLLMALGVLFLFFYLFFCFLSLLSFLYQRGIRMHGGTYIGISYLGGYLF